MQISISKSGRGKDNERFHLAQDDYDDGIQTLVVFDDKTNQRRSEQWRWASGEAASAFIELSRSYDHESGGSRFIYEKVLPLLAKKND